MSALLSSSDVTILVLIFSLQLLPATHATVLCQPENPFLSKLNHSTVLSFKFPSFHEFNFIQLFIYLIFIHGTTAVFQIQFTHQKRKLATVITKS